MNRIEFPEKLGPLFEPHRYKVLYGGRGGAKSWGIARALLLMGVQKPLRWLCAREFQTSIADSVHWLFRDQIERMGLGGFYDVQKLGIFGKNGTEFGFEGLHHNVTNLKSWEGADGAWVEEAQTVSSNSWNVLIPTIRKDGSEIWISMNPEFEDDPSYMRFIERPPKSAILININWRDNPWFPKVLEEERLELLENDPDAYDHVWEGKCRQWLEGAIYSTELRKLFLDNRVGVVPHDPSVPVYDVWDIGSTDDTAIWWFQVIRGEIHVLEGYASSHGSPSEYASQILGREVQIDLVGDDVVAKMGPMIPELEHRRKYNYARHWLPHDARAKTLAARGKSLIEQMASALTLERIGIVPDIGVEDGIQAARTMFPRVWFDKDGCDAGLKALRRYQRKLAPDGVSLSRLPMHNWASHYCLAPETKVLTRYGTYRIMELPFSGEVLTSCGWSRYINPRITRRNAPLVEVRFKGGFMVKCTPEHQFKTASGWKYAADLHPGLQIQSSLTLLRNISMAVYTAFGKARNITLAAGSISTGLFGRRLLASSLRVAIFITSTIKSLITEFQIWNACRLQSIGPNLNPVQNYRNSRVNVLPNGIGRKPVDFGIVGKPKDQKAGRNGNAKTGLACIVGKYFRALSGKTASPKNIALKSARPPLTAPGFLTKPLVIESVRETTERSDVWCLTVPDMGEFSLENGAIVHNSDAFRYLAVVWKHETKVDPKITEIEVFKKLNRPELMTLEQMYAQVPRKTARI